MVLTKKRILSVKVSPIQFFRQVRQEVKKITWPTRKEVTQVTTVVLFIVALAAAFFFLVDVVLAAAVKLVLGLGA
ncbi:MAG: preprotein translocase subunit SecE [Alphaproteobacteria bacterium]|nr:preprotein translocase subunit SecE [Alphaproteobacteria bacterium]